MNRKATIFVIVTVMGLLVATVLVTRSFYSGPRGAATGGAMGCGGDFDMEFEVPVATQIATVAGNQVLYEAKAKLTSEFMEPIKLEKNLGVTDQKVAAAYLAEFRLQVTEDSQESPDDDDTLEFVEKMVIYVRSSNPESRLKEHAVAWYYKDENEGDDPLVLEFEVDAEFELTDYMVEGFELFSHSVSGVPGDDVSVEGMAVFNAFPGM